MAIHNRATVYSPERSDDLLGGEWVWSRRHIEKVRNNELGAVMHVNDGVVWFKVLGTNHAKRKLTWTEEYPYSKMIMLTFFQDVVEVISRSIMQDVGVESFNT